MAKLKKKIDDNLGTSSERLSDSAPPIGWSDDGPNFVNEDDPPFEPLLVDAAIEDDEDADDE